MNGRVIDRRIKTRTKDYQRDTYLEGKRVRNSGACEGEQQNQESGWYKEKEKPLKNNVPVYVSTKDLGGSKNDLTSLHTTKLDTKSTRPIKKRDREKEKDHIVLKHSRESQANALESEQVKNEIIDLKSNTTVVKVDCQSQKHSE